VQEVRSMLDRYLDAVLDLVEQVPITAPWPQASGE
jgi:hypothetical protein